jgi:hypothetical protein
MYDDSVLQFYQKCISKSYTSTSRVSQPFGGKEPDPLSWAGSMVACGKITLNGTPKCPNYCVIFIVLT